MMCDALTMAWLRRPEACEWWAPVPPPSSLPPVLKLSPPTAFRSPGVRDFSIESLLGGGSPSPSAPVLSANHPPPPPEAERVKASPEWAGRENDPDLFPRKQRTVYHQFQIRHLEEAFLAQQYMVGSDRVALSRQLGLTETQVRVWFQNRRSKWRKEMREQQQLHRSASRCQTTSPSD